VQQALDIHPDLALEITQLALVDFEACRQAVLTGRSSLAESDRSKSTGPSAALTRLANTTITLNTLNSSDLPTLGFYQSLNLTGVNDGLEQGVTYLNAIDLETEPLPLTTAMTAAEGIGEDPEATLSLFDNLEDIFGGVFTTDIGADDGINHNDDDNNPYDNRSTQDLIIAEVLDQSESSLQDLLAENLSITTENTVEVKSNQQISHKVISKTIAEVEIDSNYQFAPNSESKRSMLNGLIVILKSSRLAVMSCRHSPLRECSRRAAHWKSPMTSRTHLVSRGLLVP
jgi:hypothetical protein